MTLQQILTALQGLPNIGNLIGPLAGVIFLPWLVTLGVIFFLVYRFAFKGGK